MAITVVALLDGTLIDPAQPIVRADDLGVVRGDGVFDALLAVDGEARDLDAHLERLASSATLTAHAFVTIPAMIALSLVAGALAAWVIAPRLRARAPRDALS